MRRTDLEPKPPFAAALLRRLWAFACLLALLIQCGCEQEKVTEDEAEMRAIFAKARELDAQGEYHKAMVHYETILARHPNWMSTRLNAAMAAYDSGQYSKAVGHFELLHKYGPKDWFVIRKLIQCHEHLKNDEKVEEFRKKLHELREHKDGSLLLKRYQGYTRDYIPVGTNHVIGYEFFDYKKHGRLWYFKLEDHHRTAISGFLVEASPFFDAEGHRIFYISESLPGWLRVWHVGPLPTQRDGERDYTWAKKFIFEILQGARQPLVVKPLPQDLQLLDVPDLPGSHPQGQDIEAEPELPKE